MAEIPLCPLLHRWRQIYVSLEEARARAADPAVPPAPIVFNMQGWMLSSDADKRRRWDSTLSWAKQHGFSDAIPPLAEDEQYYSDRA